MLEGAPARPSRPAPESAPGTSASTLLYAALSLVGAVALAAAALLLPVHRRGRDRGAVERAGSRAVARLRTLHSGHVGDYVAWLVAGAAAFGAALTLMVM